MKHVLFALFAVVFVATMVNAQSSAPAVITATVGDVITVEAADAELGTLATGTTYTLSPIGFLAPPNLDGESEIAPPTWTISGSPGAFVAISFLLTDRLVGGDVPIRVSYNAASAAYGPEEPSLEAPVYFFDPRQGTTLYLTDTETYVSLGGVFYVPRDATGDYEGTFVMTASYTGMSY